MMKKTLAILSFLLICLICGISAFFINSATSSNIVEKKATAYITSGTHAGEKAEAIFSYDNTKVKGIGEEKIDGIKITFTFLGKTINDGKPEIYLNDGKFKFLEWGSPMQKSDGKPLYLFAFKGKFMGDPNLNAVIRPGEPYFVYLSDQNDVGGAPVKYSSLRSPTNPDYTHEWHGEWGQWEGKTQIDWKGASLTINNCNNNICQFSLLFMPQFGNPYIDEKAKYQWTGKLSLHSPNTADGLLDTSDQAPSKCYLQFTISESAPKTLHLSGYDSAECPTHRPSVQAFPLQTHEIYEITSGEYNDSTVTKFLCYTSTSPSEKKICEDRELNTLDTKMSLLLGNYSPSSITGFGLSDMKKSCDHHADIKKCITASYSKQIQLIEKGNAQRFQSGDPAVASNLINNISGVYKKRFYSTDEDGKKKSWEDILEIVGVAKDAIYFKMVTTPFAEYECAVNGLARFNQLGTFAYSDHGREEHEEECVVEITSSSKGITLNVPRGYSCKYYCGYRSALIHEVEFDQKLRRRIRYMNRLTSSAEYINAIARLPPN